MRETGHFQVAKVGSIQRANQHKGAANDPKRPFEPPPQQLTMSPETILIRRVALTYLDIQVLICYVIDLVSEIVEYQRILKIDIWAILSIPPFGGRITNMK